MAKRIAVLTGGGHIASFHAGMYGIVKKATELGYEVIGFRFGYRGIGTREYIPLKLEDIEPDKAGSILGSSRDDIDPDTVEQAMRELDLSGLIVMGGNDHLSVASALAEAGLRVVGWPKTMDNDLSVTYCTLGYITAALKAAQTVRETHYDALTNQRVHIITLFGRNTDWVVAAAAAWGQADMLIPGEKMKTPEGERGYTIEEILERAEIVYQDNGKRYGTKFAVVAVAEGAQVGGIDSHLDPTDIDKHGNIKIEPMKLALILKSSFKKAFGKKIPVGIDTLSYGMRNCPPTPLDKQLSEAAGIKCVELIDQDNVGQSAILVQQGDRVEIGSAPLKEVCVQRFMSPMNFIDYDKMVTRNTLIDYYRPIFGEPPRKQDILYRNLQYLLKQ